MQTTRLTEHLIKPFLVEQVKAKNTIGIYSGRFQPFGPHHKKTYEWLKKKFGNAYIVTSDIKGGSRHPMNFKEKKRHMMKMGIPSNRIIKVKNPYVAKELTEKLPKDTAVVFAFGKKDAGRLATGKYFQDYKKNKNNLVGYEEHGYVLVAPHVSMRAGGLEVSGTSMRELLGHPKYEGGGKRKELFKKMFGYFDQGVFNMLTNKFRKLYERLDISIREFEGDKIGDFLTTIDMRELIKESSTSVNFEVDDGPPTYYRGFSDYKRVTKEWINNMYKGLGWKVVQYILSKGATDPDFDYTMKYTTVPAVAYGRKHTGKYGERFGVEEPIRKYKERLEGILSTVGWEVVKWLGLKDDFSGVTGVEVEAPVAFGVDGDDSNTQRAARDELTGSKLHSIEEMIDLSDYISLISGNKIKEDVKYGGKYNEVGFIEDIEIKGIGKLKAKFDTGSEVYSALHADNIKQSNGMVEFDINGKHLKKKIIGKQKVDIGSKNIEDRVVVEFPMKLGKKTYSSVRFTLADRSGNDTEVLMSKDFIDKYDFVVNVNEMVDLSDYVNLLAEGGAYGHMNHPFDDKDLTFGDLKSIIDLGLQGNLDREEAVTEKTDGQNLMITWRDGKLLAARNKGQIKSKGKSAMSAIGVARKFSGRGEIKKAFVFAMKDLEKAIGKLSDKQRKKIFDEGSNFMNLEIIYPTTANVIDYDKTVLQFHGALKYDDSGTSIGTVPGSGRILQGMIKQVNQHIQKHFKIEKPVFLKVPKHQDFSSKRSSYFGQLNKLKKQYGLKDIDTLGMYHQRYWEEYIYNATKQYKYTMPNTVLVNLTKRWAFGDKSYKIQQIRNDVDNEKFLDWILSTDKVDVEKKQKQNMKQFEILFFKLGADILKNIDGFLAASPKKAVQKIRKDVSKAINDVRKGGDLNKLNKLKQQLSKLNAIGGFKAVVPSEGLVFKYKGKTYKFTGAFAPINQITGLMTF